MFWVILLIGLYIFGVLVSRHVVAEYEPYICLLDMVMCLVPIVHWIYAFVEWFNYGGTANYDIVNKFFGKRK